MSQNLKDTHPELEENLPNLANIISEVAKSIWSHEYRAPAPDFTGTKEEHQDLLRWIRAIDPEATYKARYFNLPDTNFVDTWFDFTFSDGSTARVNVQANQASSIERFTEFTFEHED